MSELHLFVAMFHCFKLINIYWSYTRLKEQKKRAIENNIKRYNDYQSAGLITFLISLTQHLPPAVIIEKQEGPEGPGTLTWDWKCLRVPFFIALYTTGDTWGV